MGFEFGEYVYRPAFLLAAHIDRYNAAVKHWESIPRADADVERRARISVDLRHWEFVTILRSYDDEPARDIDAEVSAEIARVYDHPPCVNFAQSLRGGL